MAGLHGFISGWHGFRVSSSGLMLPETLYFALLFMSAPLCLLSAVQLVRGMAKKYPTKRQMAWAVCLLLSGAYLALALAGRVFAHTMVGG